MYEKQNQQGLKPFRITKLQKTPTKTKNKKNVCDNYEILKKSRLEKQEFFFY